MSRLNEKFESEDTGVQIRFCFCTDTGGIGGTCNTDFFDISEFIQVMVVHWAQLNPVMLFISTSFWTLHLVLTVVWPNRPNSLYR